MYMQELPKEARLHQLIGRITHFPVRLKEILAVAKRFGFEREIIAFISLFHDDTSFSSRKEFIICCEELETLHNAAQTHSPNETNIS